MTTIAVIDVETSGFEDEDPRVIELAAVIVREPERIPLSPRSFLFGLGEGRRISARASAVHHLVDADVCGLLEFDSDRWVEVTAGVDLFCAHNAAFDSAAINRHIDAVYAKNGPRWLCSMKLARAAWPDAPSFGLQVLRYHLGLTGELPTGLAPHRATYDAVVAAWLLVRLLGHFEGDVERMVRVSGEPSLLRQVHFGKHRGTLWQDAPKGYLRWVLEQDFDEDVKFTARHWL